MPRSDRSGKYSQSYPRPPRHRLHPGGRSTTSVHVWQRLRDPSLSANRSRKGRSCLYPCWRQRSLCGRRRKADYRPESAVRIRIRARFTPLDGWSNASFWRIRNRLEDHMLFHVHMNVRLPRDLDVESVKKIGEQEHARAKALQEQGKWLHLWRIAGKFANISVFDVDSPAELHDILNSLPLYPFMEVEVTALCHHPGAISADR